MFALSYSYYNTMAGGFMKNLYRTFDLYFNNKFPSRFTHYYSLKNYIQEFTYSSNLEFDDFNFYFTLLILFYLIILAIFLVNCAVQFSKICYLYVFFVLFKGKSNFIL